jgi:iron complex outermembrane receptor protein
MTLSRNKIKNYTEYVFNWTTGSQIETYLGSTSISYSPDIIVNSLFSYSFKQWDAGFQSNYVGKQYMDNTENEERKLKPYFVNGLRLSYTFLLKNINSLRIGFWVNNIFNEKYESNGYVYDTYYEGYGNEMERINELRYFPQSGTNILTNIIVKF